MKSMSNLFIVLLIMFPFSNSFSQTTISLEDFMRVFTPGSYHYYTNDEGNQYDIGQLAGPQIFDYSYVDLTNLNISNNYLISTITILAQRFPPDGITIGETPTTIENNPVFLVKGDSAFVVGQASLYNEYSFSHNVPYELLGKFPATFGLSFSQFKTKYDTTYDFNWQILGTNVSSSTEVVTIDAYGTLRLQSGDYECLRMKRDHTGYGDKEFIFMTNAGIFLDVFTSGTSPDIGLVSGGFQIFFPADFVDVENEKTPVTEYNLKQNYPNPFNPSTRIAFSIPNSANVTLKVYDILGTEVEELISNEQKAAGRYEIKFDASRLASGTYIFKLQAGKFIQTKKMILLK